MNKKIRTGLIAGVALSLSGLILFGIGYAAGGNKYVKTADLNRISGSAKQEDNKPDLILEKTELESFQSIYADLENIDFLVKPSGDESYYISYCLQSRKKENPLTFSVENGVLNLKESKGHSSTYYVHVDIDFLSDMLGKRGVEDYRNEVTVYVPEKDILENCQILLGDGDMSVDGLSCQKSELELGYGDLFLENASFSESEITLEDGDLEAENTDFSDTDLVLSYGDFEGKDCLVKGSSIILKDGDVEVERTDITGSDLELSYGDFEVKDLILEDNTILLKDGDMESSGVRFQKKNEIRNQYGDVAIRMDEENFENIILKLETEDGDIKVSQSLSGTKTKKEDAQYYERVVEGTENSLEIVSSDGDIVIK